VYPTFDDLKALLTDPVGLRFAAKLAEDLIPDHRPDLGPCVQWTGSTTPKGYGQFKVDGRNELAHRWLFKRLHGPVPDGKQLHHLCHDPGACTLKTGCPHRACVVHTTPVTRRENILAGGSPVAARAGRTRCQGKWAPRAADGTILGHDLTDPANVFVQVLANGARMRHCRACMRAADRDYKSRLRARLRAQRPAEPAQLTLV
jgi:hypothetical protein